MSSVIVGGKEIQLVTPWKSRKLPEFDALVSVHLSKTGYLNSGEQVGWNNAGASNEGSTTLFGQGSVSPTTLGAGRIIRKLQDTKVSTLIGTPAGFRVILAGALPKDEFEKVVVNGKTFLTANASLYLIDGGQTTAWVWPGVYAGMAWHNTIAYAYDFQFYKVRKH